MCGLRAGIAAMAVLGCVVSARADIIARNEAAVGSVIARKSGEEAQFIDLAGWRGVDIYQGLLVGDMLRTNAYGHLAVLFADNTQLRLGRNTVMRVKKLHSGEDSELALDQGTVWGRAERGGESVTIETPAAAAAIRGTDWTLTVEGDRTSLVVLEGVVELSNEYGSVSVAQGEAASARIGQAPTKTVIVRSSDRAQMLFYLSLRNSFTFMPASPLASPAMRAENRRIEAKPPSARGAEDWVTLAEIKLSYEGTEAALDAVEQARGFRLTAFQKARLTLIDALITGAEIRYSEAAKLFAQATPRLDRHRRAIALYGGYFARALANPDRAERPPAVTGAGPYAAIAEAWTVGFLKDVKSAIAVLKRAESEYPDDPSLPAYRAQLAVLLDDRDQVKEAIDRALAIDHDDPTALEARATYRSNIEGNGKAALADLLRASEVAPGSSSIWNSLGLIQSARGANREAEAALKRSIALDPHDPAAHANLAILYLDQGRVREAKAEIDRAIELDPSFDVALVARGRYHLQTGELEKARHDLLAGTTANPAYAQGLLLLAGGYYESGDREPAAQALENADRLDPNDPVTSSFKTAVAIDDYDSDAAIAGAQEMLKRSRARGGDYAPLSANKDAGSTLNNAFRLQGLDAWGRYYGDAVFDPFNGASYVDQAIAGSANPFFHDFSYGVSSVEPRINAAGFSSLFQGLMLDPAMLTGRSRSANFFRRPFLEGSVGGGFVSTGKDWGWRTEAEVQAYSATPIPWSLYGKFEGLRSTDFRTGTAPGLPIPNVQFDLDDKDFSGTGYLTARPTPNDRVVAYVDVRKNDSDFLNGLVVPFPPIPFIDATTYDRTVRDKTGTAGVAWSHTFGYRNVANFAVFGSGFRRSSHEDAIIFFDPGGGAIPIGARTLDKSVDQTSYLVAANHIYGVGDLTLRYGVEGGKVGQTSLERDLQVDIFNPPTLTVTPHDLDLDFVRAYADALYEVTPDLKFEGALYGNFLSGQFDGASIDIKRADPRFAIAWAPVDGHWLRGGFQRETAAADSTTLAPIGVLGLQSNQAPLAIGGYSDTFAARWDAQWNDRLFTSLDYQHQELNGVSIPIPGSLDTIDIASGRIDRVAATANLWIGHGFGAFGTYANAVSRDTDPSSPGAGGSLPFVPEHSARLGLTWVNPHNVKATVAVTYVGPRAGNQFGDRVAGYWTADAFLTWEPLDKQFALELAGYNLFDQRFEVAPSSPGWGRTVTGTFKVRF